MDDIKQIENAYKTFMGITSFPTYSLQYKKFSFAKADSKGFDTVAEAKYDYKTGRMLLVLSNNVPFYPYLLYHEFTHLIDDWKFAKCNAERYVGLLGYTEYHASQVELMYLLGADNIHELLSFSMSQTIHTVGGNFSVQSYLNIKQNTAMDLFNSSNFTSDFETSKTALGVLFNYWGLRSICMMYSIDYKETIDNSAFLKHISTQDFSFMNSLMHGWLKDSDIEASIVLFHNIFYKLIQLYNLR